MGAGGRHETICERKRAETLLLGSQGGSGEASRRFRGVAAFRRCWRVGGLMKRGTKTKKGGRYAEPWVPVQEGRKEGRDKLAWLDRGNCAGPAVTGPGGFPIGNLMVKGIGGSLKEKSLKCQGLFQPTRG